MRDLFKMFNEKKQDLILWRIKPSLVRILTSIMELHGVPFKHCYTEEQLENILEGINNSMHNMLQLNLRNFYEKSILHILSFSIR